MNSVRIIGLNTRVPFSTSNSNVAKAGQRCGTAAGMITFSNVTRIVIFLSCVAGSLLCCFDLGSAICVAETLFEYTKGLGTRRRRAPTFACVA